MFSLVVIGPFFSLLSDLPIKQVDGPIGYMDTGGSTSGHYRALQAPADTQQRPIRVLQSVALVVHTFLCHQIVVRWSGPNMAVSESQSSPTQLLMLYSLNHQNIHH